MAAAFLHHAAWSILAEAEERRRLDDSGELR
jgi:hypothetical protein